jgi:hypothetical protein
MEYTYIHLRIVNDENYRFKVNLIFYFIVWEELSKEVIIVNPDLQEQSIQLKFYVSTDQVLE